MLTGLGFSPLRAATICLLANTAPVAFGSLGIPLITLSGTTGLPLHAVSLSVALLCAPLAAVLPVYTMFAVGGCCALNSAWAPALLAGCLFAAVQYAVCRFLGPQLADILAAVISVLSLIVLFRLRPTSGLTESDAVRFRAAESNAEQDHEDDAVGLIPPGDLLRAWSPYIFLVLSVLLWNVPALRLRLEHSAVTIAWPFLNNLVLRGLPFFATPRPYPAIFLFNPAAAAGTACMVAVLATVITTRVRLVCVRATVVGGLPATDRAGVDRSLRDGDGVCDELRRPDRHPWKRAGSQPCVVSFIQRVHWMAGSLSDRFRHLVQRPVRQSAGRDGDPPPTSALC